MKKILSLATISLIVLSASVFLVFAPETTSLEFHLEPLIEGSADDHSPYIFQDSTKKIWVFFISVGRVDTPGDNRHLFFITSVDQGMTWTEPALFEPAYVPGLTVQYPIAFQDSNGRIYVAWLNHTAPSNADQIWFSTSDDGEDWTPREQLCPGHNDTGFAFIEVAGNVWLVFSRSASALCYRTTVDGGEYWSDPIPISSYTGRYPHAIVLQNGTIFLTFHQIYGGVTCLTSSDQGETWQSAICDDPPGPDWSGYARSIEQNGRIYLFFRRVESQQIWLRVWNETVWESPQQVTGEDLLAGMPNPNLVNKHVWFTFDVAYPSLEDYDVWRARVEIDKTAPTVTITSPVAYGIYAADSGETYSFSATDNLDPSPQVTAVVYDFAGNVYCCPVSGDLLPTESGVYRLIVTATDEAGHSTTEEVMFVVYDASAGFVTGGGWIIPEPELGEYKATFGFVAKYHKNAETPDGNLEFQYNFMDINLKSEEIEWLVVSNTQALFKGTATINGEGLYTFMVHANDGDLTGGQSDSFMIKIWEGTDTEVDPVHQYNGDLGGGNIKIHKK